MLYEFKFGKGEVIEVTETTDGIVHFTHEGTKGKIEKKLLFKNFKQMKNKSAK
jgi:hypothetical protein